MRALADWWDRFATSEVSDVPRLHGGERPKRLCTSQGHLRNGTNGSKPNDRQRGYCILASKLEGFTSPAAFSQVIEALLEQQDWRAAMALLITWLSEIAEDTLEDGSVSFHDLASKWLDGTQVDPNANQLIPRFFDLLPTNAEEYWKSNAR